MSQYVVGVAGGYGRVGIHAVRYLADCGNFRIIIGGRDGEAARRAAESAGGNVSGTYLDVYDADSLAAFTGRCDLLLNCAGPSNKISLLTASAALRMNKHYVDVSGEEEIHDFLAGHQKEIAEKDLSFIVSAGMLPGLSGIFPLASVGEDFEAPDSLKLYYCGIDEFTFASAYDYVSSLESRSGTAMAYCLNGDVRKGGGPEKDVAIPFFKNSLYAYPYVDTEMIRLSEKIRNCRVYFYNVFPGKNILEALNHIQAFRQYRTQSQKEKSAQMLVAAARKDLEHESVRQVYHLVVEGKRGGRNEKATVSLCSRDSYELTGVIAAIAVSAVFSRVYARKGLHILLNGIDKSYVMESLLKHPVILNHQAGHCCERKMDEGVI